MTQFQGNEIQCHYRKGKMWNCPSHYQSIKIHICTPPAASTFNLILKAFIFQQALLQENYCSPVIMDKNMQAFLCYPGACIPSILHYVHSENPLNYPCSQDNWSSSILYSQGNDLPDTQVLKQSREGGCATQPPTPPLKKIQHSHQEFQVGNLVQQFLHTAIILPREFIRWEI